MRCSVKPFLSFFPKAFNILTLILLFMDIEPKYACKICHECYDTCEEALECEERPTRRVYERLNPDDLLIIELDEKTMMVIVTDRVFVEGHDEYPYVYTLVGTVADVGYTYALKYITDIKNMEVLSLRDTPVEYRKLLQDIASTYKTALSHIERMEQKADADALQKVVRVNAHDLCNMSVVSDNSDANCITFKGPECDICHQRKENPIVKIWGTAICDDCGRRFVDEHF